MKKIIVILGNITFHHFVAEELALFSTDKESKALVHEVYSVLLYDNEERAYEMADDAESYVLFPDFIGELVFESEAERLKTIKEIECLIGLTGLAEYSNVLATALKL